MSRSTQEVAKALGVHEQTVRAWCRDGKIEAVKPGGISGSWLIPDREYERLVGEPPPARQASPDATAAS